MQIQLKRCRTCGVLGVGPNAVKLFPLDNLFYCKPHYGKSLDWAVNREIVISGVKHELTAYNQPVPKRKWQAPHWRCHIEEQAGMAAEALVMGDRRTFVYYFARALWAWELSRET